MAYPPNPARRRSFVNDEARGLTSPSPSGVDAELDMFQDAVYRLRQVVVGITNSDGTLKPGQTVNAVVTEVQAAQEETAAGGSPETFTFDTAIDSDTQSVHVYKNGLRVLDSALTVTDTTVALNTTASDAIAIEFYDNEGGLATNLADATDPALGSGLVGYNDQSGYQTELPITNTATTINDAMDGALQNIVGIGDDFYPTSQWLRADGTTSLSADWDVGGSFRISNHPASTTDGEVVVHEQLQALTDDLSGLNTSFLDVNGTNGMLANLDMNSFKIVELTAGTASGQAVEYDQLNTALAAYLPLAGGTMSGNIAMGSNKVTGLAAASSSGEAVEYAQFTARKVEALPTDSTDTSLVLKPDGAGGVAFSANTVTESIPVTQSSAVDDDGNPGKITLTAVTLDTTVGSMYRWCVVVTTSVDSFTMEFAEGWVWRYKEGAGDVDAWDGVCTFSKSRSDSGVFDGTDIAVTVNGSNQIVLTVQEDLDGDTYFYTVEKVR